ncbi:hypothetical protein JX265_000731 [Neoarthrinium moseri]|uniref:U1-type domain-containing protein n=1 Tax=Neoarthrinium moseri TaxID=1658444 RepID=A0A9P9WWT3_9PEZI|nr:uncharacterized protein JN550_013587 [Neoarthrinium moseri]KAI1856917.1 hypothetical protein JN550_013587 [Neoarthrinium moseri]KAI1880491.1 hypothetical protein JX265_000731 [Neoarthrinium moseri]
MSEYWKSTPKYWCKHCSVYVRDTKLERSNHESTGKHQGALKRFLRDLHRGHDREEKEKERAKREIDRLNGVVGSSSGSGSASGSSAGPSSSAPRLPANARTTETQRQKQWEQLADLGIDVPTELRGDMAMAGDWQVTNMRVVDDTPKTDENGNPKVDAIATGVRKRVRKEGEEEEEQAMAGLFKKPRKWGRDTKQAPEDDAELDALLTGSLAPIKSEEKIRAKSPAETKLKKEEDHTPVKDEPSEDDRGVPDMVKAEPRATSDTLVKPEEASEAGGFDVPAVVFKKRKPKSIRQK